MHRQVDAIQMGTHNICLYEEVDKNYTGCNLKTAELPECALIGACAVIRSNTVCEFWACLKAFLCPYIEMFQEFVTFFFFFFLGHFFYLE